MDTFEAKPIRTATRQVPAEWIDYNGHMNVAFYVMAIDKALDEAFDELGMGVALVDSHRMGPMALVNQIHYLDELLEGQHYYCEFQILDGDHKRIHLFVTMHHVEKGTVAATYESLSMNVDLEKTPIDGLPARGTAARHRPARGAQIATPATAGRCEDRNPQESLTRVDEISGIWQE